MTIAVMQPYIFPYLGYYQLVGAVDQFVFFDDVNFINKGWINRNRILQQNEPYKFTIPLSRASQNRLINEIEFSDYKTWKENFIRLIDQNYKKAPHFEFVISWLKDFLNKKNYGLIKDLTSDSISALAVLFELKTGFLNSSELHYKTEVMMNGQEKILSICKLLSADKYINPRNGMEIYDESKFESQNIELKFIIMDDIQYKQWDPQKFQSSLSILDVMMFNDLKSIKEMLVMYQLINKEKQHEIE